MEMLLEGFRVQLSSVEQIIPELRKISCMPYRSSKKSELVSAQLKIRKLKCTAAQRLHSETFKKWQSDYDFTNAFLNQNVPHWTRDHVKLKTLHDVFERIFYQQLTHQTKQNPEELDIDSDE